MKVVDLDVNLEKLYFVCLEDWSDEVSEGGNRKEIWFNEMKNKGLRVKVATDDKGVVGGMIQYVPIEHSPVEGSDLYFILCIWVHGHKQGRGNFQGRGMGKALLSAAEEDVRGLGTKGLVAWGMRLPVFMRAKWFRKQGYEPVDKDGLAVLLWKPFSEDAVPPRWIKERKKPATIPGKVTVTAFVNGWCPAGNMTIERAKRAAAEFKDKVVFREIDTVNRATFLEYGIFGGLYVDDKQIRTGPPPSYEKIRKQIAKKVKRLKTSQSPDK